MDDAVAVGEAGRLEDLADQRRPTARRRQARVDQLLQRAALEVAASRCSRCRRPRRGRRRRRCWGAGGRRPTRPRGGSARRTRGPGRSAGAGPSAPPGAAGAGPRPARRRPSRRSRSGAAPGSGRRSSSPSPQPTHSQASHLDHRSFVRSGSLRRRRGRSAPRRRAELRSVHSTVAAIAICGSSAGAKPMNQAWFSSAPPPQASLPGVSAVPVLPATGDAAGSPRWCRCLR